MIKIHLTLKLILSWCHLALHTLHTEPGVNAALATASLPLLGCLSALALASLVINELVSLFARGNSRASVGAGRKSRGFLCKDAQIHHLRSENNFFFLGSKEHLYVSQIRFPMCRLFFSILNLSFGLHLYPLSSQTQICSYILKIFYPFITTEPPPQKKRKEKKKKLSLALEQLIIAGKKAYFHFTLNLSSQIPNGCSSLAW